MVNGIKHPLNPAKRAIEIKSGRGFCLKVGKKPWPRVLVSMSNRVLQ